jgi:head-tail adaptor
MGLKPAQFSAGQLSHRVTLRAPAGSFGAATDTDLATSIPAKIVPVPLQFQAREQLSAGGLNGQTAYTITVRYREDVRRDHQLIEECHTQRTFQIVTIQPTDRGDALEITCVVGER